MDYNAVERDELLAKERAKRLKRKRTLNSILAFVVCMVVFIVVMVLCVVGYIWVDEALQDNLSTAIQVDQQAQIEAAGEVAVTYTESQIEELIVAAKAEGELEGADKILETLQTSLSEGKSVAEVLRPLYADQLIVVSGGKYNFVPIDKSLKMHSYVAENLTVNENGFYEYVENGQLVSHKGIDVSKHQGEIDWAQVAADGVEFAFIRVGNRGYGSGLIVLDEQFESNIKGATTNGIKAGVYFFSQATTEEEAIEEANFVLENIAPYKIECPVVVDVEKVSDSQARMNLITKEQRTANVKAFCETIAAAGYTPMIYHNMEMATMFLDMSQLEDYQKWFAYYNNQDFYYPYAYDVLQYSDKGKVSGISGDVDLNISFHLWE
ncbi:MAG: glycoside hydrolase family 25 protein [Lachnospiraceae bacterium]|nr:glycoside hydrolase family 25 protein [Lachnospiraceae bacterium]